MALYWLVSPQRKLHEIARRSRESRHRLLDTSRTELPESLAAARELIRWSGAQLLMTLLPAVVAAVPFLALLTWVSDRYGYELPRGGDPVTVAVTPEGTRVQSVPAGLRSEDPSRLTIAWPAPGRPLLLLDTEGRNLVRLTGDHPVTRIQKSAWWNWLLGNPAGYLPHATRDESITYDLKTREFLALGPSWARSPESLFIVAAFVVSLALKCAFNIR
jgi:hypothetical protein